MSVWLVQCRNMLQALVRVNDEQRQCNMLRIVRYEKHLDECRNLFKDGGTIFHVKNEDIICHQISALIRLLLLEFPILSSHSVVCLTTYRIYFVALL